MSITDLAGAGELIKAAGLDVAAVFMIIDDALAEDLGGRGVLPEGAGYGVDVTSVATIAADARAVARLVLREDGVLAGTAVAAATFARVCEPAGPYAIEVTGVDGSPVRRGDLVLTVEGNTRAVLTGERIALNLITMMSGVATATSAWVDALAGTSTRVRDTRKTTPGLRTLQKYAVRIAGGVNHRKCLADAALIKDNHVIAAGGVVPAYRSVRARYPELPIQVEVTKPEQVGELVAAGATEILLDNMAPETMRSVVAEFGDAVVFEASGGLTLADAAAAAATGVDYVAVGAITHSAPILDLALDFVEP
ncbi:carboxylating nicotinate-nucleotide diphosphorylase [Microlunatus speluncae]|uniref:carboxylating nicotinate-nucleotide diphosphorylase n=1 Tax=Microlunatus speluncae TaxID=2594267 RepID=UPI001C2D0E25|nr:carboxylating nicotinate-nucleotide diphosphorylase [Microlunatus speluncae]